MDTKAEMIRSLFTSAFLLSLSIITLSQTHFESEATGFSIEIPEAWHETHEDIVLESVDGYKWDDGEFELLVSERKGSIPLVYFFKYLQTEHADIIPTVQVNLRVNEAVNFENFKASIAASAKTFETVLDNFKFDVPPTEIMISGIKSMYFIGSYDLTQGAKTYRIRSGTYAIPKDKMLFQVNFTDEPGVEDCEDIFSHLLGTIEIKD
jgi:hypothetical protein